ncbi:UNVERIFIED_CONTAM: hypothetical protein Sradi_3850500 [Sesamum radiatum]|uniref:Aminotransferase-like plant mobile domain-containing protein n=1 Tax=Sesamum radiatum TaxID=300843 RepID=A0AAW2Q1R8_SESRA
MVYFKYKSFPSGEHHLIILDDQHQPMLAVYAPLVSGRNVMKSGIVIFNLSESFIIPNDNRSGLKMCLAGLERNYASSMHMMLFMLRCSLKITIPTSSMRFVKVVPLMNTLLTSAEELSISLWNLHDLAGLSMMGCLYDEVVPSVLELTSVDEKGGSLKEEVYLVVYLACWLCTFVLPGKDVNSIHPSTFKMTSIMASDQRVSLVIPVLASIYEGLNTIAASSRPARTSPSFTVHFVYVWLASYFKTHYLVWQGLRGSKMMRFSGEEGTKYYNPQEARKWIHKAKFVSLACNMIVKNRPFKFVDNGHAEELEHNYFVAIRSSYLTLRQGDKFIIEPYCSTPYDATLNYY